MAAVSELTLFDSIWSPYCQRVKVALAEKGIQYKCIQVNPANKPHLLLESNPIHKKIPTIIYKGKPVAESMVILEFLEDEWPEEIPLMPKDAYAKSQVRFWSDYINKGMGKFADVQKAEPGTPKEEAAKEVVVKVMTTLESAMASYSSEGPFFTGETFGLLDVVLAPIVYYLHLAERRGVVVEPAEIPRVTKWIAAVKARPSFKSAIPSNEEMVSFSSLVPEKRKEAYAANAASTAELV